MSIVRDKKTGGDERVPEPSRNTNVTGSHHVGLKPRTLTNEGVHSFVVGPR